MSPKKELRQTFSPIVSSDSRLVGLSAFHRKRRDRRKLIYRLTEKGIDLAPVLVELILWGDRHEDTAAPRAVIRKMQKQREEFLVDLRRRWAEADSSSH